MHCNIKIGKNFPLLIQITIVTPQSNVHQYFFEAGGLQIAIVLILMGNTTLVVKWQSMRTVKIFLLKQAFTITRLSLM